MVVANWEGQLDKDRMRAVLAGEQVADEPEEESSAAHA
jgi:aerobic C4-dicarboxylate transport protein